MRWSPAVGAATDPGSRANTVWYRSGSPSGAVMYGGSGISPMRSIRSSSSTVTTRRPSSSTSSTTTTGSPSTTPSTAPATNSSAPVRALRPGLTRACHWRWRPVGSSSSTSTAPPVGRTRCNRAGSTLVSFTTSRSPGSSRSGRSRTMRCSGSAPGPRSTNNRAASRGSHGCWAIASSGSG